MPPQQKVKILFISANPWDTTRLKLGEEYKKIDSELLQSAYREHFELHQIQAASSADLQELLLRHRPDVVHFSGHGSEAGALIFEDAHGYSQELRPEALTDLLKIVNRDNNIRCIVLDACYSERQADAISKYVDCVVGMSNVIPDQAAIKFSVGFYRAIGYAKSIKDAFDLGRNDLDLQNMPEGSIPILKTRAEVDANSIVLVDTKKTIFQPDTPVEPEILHRREKKGIRRELLVAIIAGPLATLIALAWPAIGEYMDDVSKGNIINLKSEDCEGFSPEHIGVEKRGQDWMIVDKANNFVLLDFKANQDNAERGVEVIKSYGFNKICFVGRPYNPISNPVLPMMYFTVNGTAAKDTTNEQGCQLINPKRVVAQRVGDNWLVLDNNVRIFDFGSGQNSENNAKTAVEVIKSYNFNKVCFVDRPFQPMRYYLAPADNAGAVAGFIYHIAAGDSRGIYPQRLVLETAENPTAPIYVDGDPSVGAGPNNSTTSNPGNTTDANPNDTTVPQVHITYPANGALIDNSDIWIRGISSDVDTGVVSVQISIDGNAFYDAPQQSDWSEWQAPVSFSSDGAHTVTARAVDAAGLYSASDTISVITDTAPPSLSVASPAINAVISVHTLRVSGTASDGNGGSGIEKIQYQIRGTNSDSWSDAQGTTSWQLTEELGDGDYTVHLRAIDRAGNLSPTTMLSVTIDTGVTAGEEAASNTNPSSGIPDLASFVTVPEMVQVSLPSVLSLRNIDTGTILSRYITLESVQDGNTETVAGSDGQQHFVTTIAYPDRYGRQDSNNNPNIFLQISHTDDRITSVKGVQLGGNTIEVIATNSETTEIPNAEEIEIPGAVNRVPVVSQKVRNVVNSNLEPAETPISVGTFLDKNIELVNTATNERITHYVLIQTVPDVYAEKILGIDGQYVTTLAFQDRPGGEDGNSNLDVFLQISHTANKVNSLRGMQLGEDDIQVYVNGVNGGLVTKTVEISY